MPKAKSRISPSADPLTNEIAAGWGEIAVRAPEWGYQYAIRAARLLRDEAPYRPDELDDRQVRGRNELFREIGERFAPIMAKRDSAALRALADLVDMLEERQIVRPNGKLDWCVVRKAECIHDPVSLCISHELSRETRGVTIDRLRIAISKWGLDRQDDDTLRRKARALGIPVFAKKSGRKKSKIAAQTKRPKKRAFSISKEENECITAAAKRCQDRARRMKSAQKR